MTAHRVDRAVERIARRQHGAFTRRQAMSVGATDTIISARHRSEAWIWLTHSVYALAAAPPTWHRALKAAELSIDGGAVAGNSAACLHRLPDFRPGGIQLVVPPGRNPRSPLAVVRRSELAALTTIEGIRVTTMAQTLFDIAGEVSFARLEAAVDHVLLDRRLRLAELTARFEVLHAGRPRGIGAMRALLEARADGFLPPASELERTLYRLLDSPNLPPHIRQADLPWRPSSPQRLDALIPAWRLIVEADGRRWHTRVRDFESDRRRDQAAVAHGYRVLRFTWSHLSTEPEDALSIVRQAGRWNVHAHVQETGGRANQAQDPRS